jgi:hypothetical protein
MVKSQPIIQTEPKPKLPQAEPHFLLSLILMLLSEKLKLLSPQRRKGR